MIDKNEAWLDVEKAVGQTIVSIDGIFFGLDKEHVEENEQFLQVNFLDGSILLLQGSSADGESLISKNVPWIDPFADKITPEFLSYLKKYGRWWLIDISAVAPFNELIGKTIDALFPIITKYDVLSGVQFVINGQYLNFVHSGGFHEIFWGQDPPELSQRLTLIDHNS